MDTFKCKKLILVDMDGVLADFDLYLEQKCIERNDLILLQKLKNRTTMKLSDTHDQNKVTQIIQESGFFYNLPAIPGSIQAVKEMVHDGHTVMICTTPTGSRSIIEKYEWIQDNFGEEFISNIIITYDKTIIQGDYLIDDNHEISGFNKTPAWKHILFDRFYNQTGKQSRMYSWDSWKNFIH